MTKFRRAIQTTPSWLPLLMKCYAAMDRSVSAALCRHESPGERLACSAGCSQCCNQPIPASLPEMAGAVWRLRTACDRLVQKTVIAALLATNINRCPFLVNDRCSVYSLRFLACRGYGVFGSPCLPGEDPWENRQGDLLRVDPEGKLLALTMLASLLGYDSGPDPDTLRGIIMRFSPPVQIWVCSQPDLFIQVMDKGPPFPYPHELRIDA